ncbi:MAG: DUF1492 domain-containing protein [Clostridiales bacterium]|nr:DUF1492 domain-containing protein [Clostridiales bacterium]
MLKRIENGKEIVVNNRDIIVLQRVFFAMQDVCALEQKYQWEEDRLFHITAHLSPAAGGGARKGHDDGVLDGMEKKDEYFKSAEKYKNELKEAEDIINSIENKNMRTFVVLMYVFMMNGEEVRKRLNMTQYSFQQARKAIEDAENMQKAVWHDRYMLKNGTE